MKRVHLSFGLLVATVVFAGLAGLVFQGCKGGDGSSSGSSTVTLEINSGSTYAFGTVSSGSTATAEITVEPSGGTATSVSAAFESGTNFDFTGGEYPGTDGTCGTSISEDCTLDITLSSASDSEQTDTLTITFNNGSEDTSATLVMTANASASSSLSFSGSSQDFGQVELGQTSSDITITLTHSGSSTVDVTASGLTGTPFAFKGGAGFPGTGGTCENPVSTTCTMVMVYTPTAEQADSATLSLAYRSDGEDQTATISLSGEGIVTITEFAVTATKPDSTYFTYYLSELGDKATDCVAAAGEYSQCYLDIEEHDLFMNDTTLNYTIPGDLCYYARVRGYFYQVAPYTYPPGAVSYTTDADGNITACTFVIGSTTYDCDGTVGGGEIAFDSEQWDGTSVPLVFSAAGDVSCPYDHTSTNRRFGGETLDCCWGTYTLTTTDSEGNVTVTDQSWSGKAANCFRGPWKEQWVELGNSYEDSGLPGSHNFWVQPEGATWQFDISPTIDIDDDYDYPMEEIIWAANFHDTAARPTAMYGSDGWAFPFYRVDCLDHNAEVTARIDVMIRAWDEAGELAKAAGVGDPDSGEAGGNEGAPFDDPFNEKVDDYRDWSRFAIDGRKWPGFGID